MSLALPAALLLLLVLPGYIFVYTYKGRLRPQNDALVSNASMTASWIIGLLGAIVAHALWVPLCNCLLRRTGQSLRVDMNSVAYLLAGEYKEGFHSAASALTNYPYQVMGYFASLYVVAAALGALSHYLVRTGRWDRRFRSLRFNNKWYYLFPLMFLSPVSSSRSPANTRIKHRSIPVCWSPMTSLRMASLSCLY